MTGRRGWYVAGLVAAVVALVLSLGAAVAVVSHPASWWGAPAASAPWWGQDDAGGGMMGAQRGGMMGRWDDDEASVTAAQATAIAKAWVEVHEPGATLGQPVWMPMGYLFTVTRGEQVIGAVMVDDDSGQLVWRGAVQPAPTTTES